MRDADLRSVVAVNEQIKRVVGIAFSVDISALNATLLAVKSGRRALGFGIVAHEMRIFSRSLAAIMKEISALTFESVRTVSSMLKGARYMRVLERVDLDGAFAKKLEVIKRRHRSDLETSQHLLEELRAKIGALVEGAKDECSFGSAVSRIAKVEATYADDNRSSLEETSRDFDVSISEVANLLNTLRRTLRRIGP